MPFHANAFPSRSVPSDAKPVLSRPCHAVPHQAVPFPSVLRQATLFVRLGRVERPIRPSPRQNPCLACPFHYLPRPADPYRGQHCHPCPTTPRKSFQVGPSPGSPRQSYPGLNSPIHFSPSLDHKLGGTKPFRALPGQSLPQPAPPSPAELSRRGWVYFVDAAGQVLDQSFLPVEASVGGSHVVDQPADDHQLALVE